MTEEVILAIIEQVLLENPEKLKELEKLEKKYTGFLMGQILKTEKRASVEISKKILLTKLNDGIDEIILTSLPK